MGDARIDRAYQRLLEMQRGSGIWPYRPRMTQAVEPTALAGLALLASKGNNSPAHELATSAGRWLESQQRSDGSVGVSPNLPQPGWPTPLALMLWAGVGGFEKARGSAVSWLLRTEGTTVARSANDPMGHDSTIVGWPWVEATHSWVEPTATAILALGVSGKIGEVRVKEGARLLVDRAIPSGGWNLGNPKAFGTYLRSLPGPTGLALLALARTSSDSAVVAPAVSYLKATLAETLAPVSLGWGLLALRAWDADGEGMAAARIDEALARVEGREVSVPELALLLLAAAGDRSLELLGIKPSKGGEKS